MSRSKLRNKWMQKVYADFGRSFANSKMPNIHRNPHRLDEVPKMVLMCIGFRSHLRMEVIAYQKADTGE